MIIDKKEIIKELFEQIKNGEIEVINISFEPHLEQIYLTDDLRKKERKSKLEYYDYNIVLRKYINGEKGR